MGAGDINHNMQCEDHLAVPKTQTFQTHCSPISIIVVSVQIGPSQALLGSIHIPVYHWFQIHPTPFGHRQHFTKHCHKLTEAM